MPAKSTKKGTAQVKSRHVDGDLRFFVVNGQSIGSIEELSQNIASFDDNILNHHVNGERNDFADWIENVFEDKTLANKLRKARTRQDMQKALQ